MTGNGQVAKTRVLLVDDDPELVWVVGKYLTKAGYAITTCADGAEAIDLLETREVDCVVTDIKMPNVNGVALVDWLRRNRPSVRVVVMTAFGSPFVRELVLGKGAVLYLEKPVDPQLLVDVISREDQKEAFSGTISDIDIMDYLQLMVLAGKRAVIEISSREGKRGLVFVYRRPDCPRHMRRNPGRRSSLPLFDVCRGEFLQPALERARQTNDKQTCGILAYRGFSATG